MTVNEILDTLEDLVERSWSLPLTGGRAAISVRDVIDLIDEVRLALPKEIKQAKMIVTDRKDIIADAKKEAAGIIADAEKKAQRMVAENEIVQRAQERANHMLASAHSQSSELRRMTNNYVENLLSAGESALMKNTQELKSAHNEIRRLIKEKTNP